MATPSPQNPLRPSSAQPVIHAAGRRISASLQRNLSGSVDWRGSQDCASRLGLRDLPMEIHGLIDSAASPMDRNALAEADPRELYPRIKWEMRAAFITTTHAPTVNMLAGFNALLPEIQCLHQNLQGEPLAALGARIACRPPNEQQPAIDAFLASAQNLPAPRPALLDDLMQAAANRPGGLAAREKAVVAFFNGPASVAVRGGENVQAAAQRYGIINPAAIALLEMTSVTGPAGADVMNGGSVTATAERYGIAGAYAIRTLERISVDGYARAAVWSGASVTAAAERYGIADAGAIRTLENISADGPAGMAVWSGASVTDTAERYGITGAYAIGVLERISVNGYAGAA